VNPRPNVKVLAAVIPGPILAEYEAAVRAAGYEPGAVLPASLAAENSIHASARRRHGSKPERRRPHHLHHQRPAACSSIAPSTCPPTPPSAVEEVQRGIAVAAAYFEDKLLVRPTRLHYAGIGAADSFARFIADPDLEVVDLAPRPETGAATALGNLSIAAARRRTRGGAD
jgi:type IV pilus assembly protein PilM